MLSLLSMKIKKSLIRSANILAALFIIGAAVLIVLYSQGYRFDKDENKLQKTGVITVNGAPLLSDLYLNGKKEGRIPHSISSLREGIYDLKVSRKGYKSWNKKAPVYAEKSSILYAYLLKESPDKEVVFKIDDQFEDAISINDSGEIYIITSKTLNNGRREQLSETETGKEKEFSDDSDDLPIVKAYRIWKYKTNPYFWEISSNPQIVFESNEAEAESDFSFEVSPNGKYILVSRYSEVDKASSIEVWKSNGDLNQSPVRVPSTLLNHSPIWSNSEENILFTSEEEILNYNVERESTAVLFKGKTEEAIWDTDENNFFYLVSKDPKSQVDIEQIDIETGKRLENKLIEELPVGQTEVAEKTELTDPANITEQLSTVQIEGTITSIKVLRENEYVVITTSAKSYFHDLSNNEYQLISAEPLSLVDTTDEVALLKSESDLKLFRYKKDEGDPITALGTKTVKFSQNAPDDPTWHKLESSGYIFYTSNGWLQSIDSDGENNYKILPLGNSFYTQDRDGRYIYTTEDTETAKALVKYKIH